MPNDIINCFCVSSCTYSEMTLQIAVYLKIWNINSATYPLENALHNSTIQI